MEEGRLVCQTEVLKNVSVACRMAWPKGLKKFLEFGLRSMTIYPTFFMLLFMHNRSKSTLIIPQWVRWLIKDAKAKSTLQLWEGSQLSEATPSLREKECFVQVTLSLPEVMWDNLSFVFQAFWGHLGHWLFEDHGGRCWGHSEIHPQDSVSSKAAQVTSFSRFPQPNSPVFLFKHSAFRKNTCDYHI